MNRRACAFALLALLATFGREASAAGNKTASQNTRAKDAGETGALTKDEKGAGARFFELMMEFGKGGVQKIGQLTRGAALALGTKAGDLKQWLDGFGARLLAWGKETATHLRVELKKAGAVALEASKEIWHNAQAAKKWYDELDGKTLCDKVMNNLVGWIDPFQWLFATAPEMIAEELWDVSAKNFRGRNPVGACYKGFRNGFACRVPDLIEEIVSTVWGYIKTTFKTGRAIVKALWNLATGPKAPECVGTKWPMSWVCGGYQAARKAVAQTWAKMKGAAACVRNGVKYFLDNPKTLLKNLALKGLEVFTAVTGAACNAAGRFAFDAMIAAASQGGGTPAVIAGWVQSAIQILEHVKTIISPASWMLFGVASIPGFGDWVHTLKIDGASKAVDGYKNLARKSASVEAILKDGDKLKLDAKGVIGGVAGKLNASDLAAGATKKTKSDEALSCDHFKQMTGGAALSTGSEDDLPSASTLHKKAGDGAKNVGSFGQTKEKAKTLQRTQRFQK